MFCRERKEDDLVNPVAKAGERATDSDAAPPDGCGALLRVEVAPIAASIAATLHVGEPYYYAPPVGYSPPPPPPELGPRSGREVTGIVATSVGAAGLAVGLGAGLAALIQSANLSNDCPDGHCGPSKTDAVGSYHTSTTLSTIGFVAGGGLLATGIVLLATAPPRAIVRKAPKSAWITPALGPAGLGFTGGFR